MRPVLSTAVVLLLIAAVVSPVSARNGGSGYSRYGIGDLQYGLTSGLLGMAGSGLAVVSASSINGENPADWTSISRVRISFTGLYEGYKSSDYESSGYFSTMRFSGLMIAIPLVSSSGITFTAGVNPYSNVNYNISIPTTLGGYDYVLQYLGEGGISQGTMGVSWRPGAALSLGAKLDYYFGTLRHSVTQMFAGNPPQYTTAADLRSTSMTGLGSTFGATFRGLGDLLHIPAGHTLSLAAAVSTTSWLTASDERYYVYTTSYTSYDTLISPDRKFKLPVRIAGGISYQGDRWTVAADYYTQPWSQALDDGTPLTGIRDCSRWSFGGEYTPKTENNSPFLQRLTYRAGFFYQQSYYDINGTGVNEAGGAAGCSVPVFSDSKLGLALSYSVRGTTDQLMQKDHIIRFSLSLDIGELWFIKTPEE
ncbi:MAG TPA: hypothetical protein VMW43_13075 [Bacteroidota bacterium]|nr:hypothetical protein [Bacteroidota bacterium]